MIYMCSTKIKINILILSDKCIFCHLSDAIDSFDEASKKKDLSPKGIRSLLDAVGRFIIMKIVSELFGNLLDRAYPSIGFYDASSTIARLLNLLAIEWKIWMELAKTSRQHFLDKFKSDMDKDRERVLPSKLAAFRAAKKKEQSHIHDRYKKEIEINTKLKKILDDIHTIDDRALEKRLGEVVTTNRRSNTYLMLIYIFRKLRPFFIAHRKPYLCQLKALSVDVSIEKSVLDHMVLEKAEDIEKLPNAVFYEELLKKSVPNELPVDVFYSNLLAFQAKLSSDLSGNFFKSLWNFMGIGEDTTRFLDIEMPNLIDKSPDEPSFYDASDIWVPEYPETTAEIPCASFFDDNEITESETDHIDSTPSSDEEISKGIKVKTRKSSPSIPQVPLEEPERDLLAHLSRHKEIRNQLCKEADSMRSSARYLYENLFDMQFTSTHPTDFSSAAVPIDVWFKPSEVIILCKLSSITKGAPTLSWADVTRLFNKMGVKMCDAAGSREDWVLPKLAETRRDEARSGPVSKITINTKLSAGFVKRRFHIPGGDELENKLAYPMHEFLLEYVEFDFSRLKLQ